MRLQALGTLRRGNNRKVRLLLIAQCGQAVGILLLALVILGVRVVFHLN